MAAQRLRDRAAEVETELGGILERLGPGDADVSDAATGPDGSSNRDAGDVDAAGGADSGSAGAGGSGAPDAAASGSAGSAAQGGVLCEQCQRGQRDRLPLSPQAWQALVALSDSGEAWQRDWPKEVRGELRRFLGQYVTYLMGRQPRLLPYLGS